jgi:Zn-dependent M28 family amino/carboxypeptidase
VGVALEALDVLASSMDFAAMRAAVIFMFVSGEEEGFLGAHGVCHSHPWRHHIRAVVNLESMGAGGPSLLFRASADALGQWMLRTWVRVAPHAAGSVVAQDVFRSGLINSDTDFRCVPPSSSSTHPRANRPLPYGVNRRCSSLIASLDRLGRYSAPPPHRAPEHAYDPSIDLRLTHTS